MLCLSYNIYILYFLQRQSSSYDVPSSSSNRSRLSRLNSIVRQGQDRYGYSASNQPIHRARSTAGTRNTSAVFGSSRPSNSARSLPIYDDLPSEDQFTEIMRTVSQDFVDALRAVHTSQENPYHEIIHTVDRSFRNASRTVAHPYHQVMTLCFMLSIINYYYSGEMCYFYCQIMFFFCFILIFEGFFL